MDTFSVVVHIGETASEPEVTRVNGTRNAYTFSYSADRVGMAIVEIDVNGQQIETSPIRLQFVKRNCELDYPGEGKVAGPTGSCICGDGTIEIRDQCVRSVIVIIFICVAVLLLAVQLGYSYLNYKKRQNDQLWHINVDELNFDDPVKVIGQGAFGVVVLAEYRGTQG